MSEGYFPALVAPGVELSDEQAQRAARQLSLEVQRRSMALATILEPLLIVLMGLVVGVIVLAVLQPIIELNSWVK